MSHTPRPLTRQHRSATCLVAGCLGFLLVSTTTSAAQSADPPLVVFGDSLSDSGNAFAFLHQNATPPDFGLDSILVPSAPYAIAGHHFTNGDTWIEQLAARFGVGQYTLPAFASANPNAMNFAVATARARDDGTCGANPTPACHPSLSLLIASFLQKTGGVAPPRALYVIQIGANDVRDALTRTFVDPPGAQLILQSATQAVADGVMRLYAAGARHFLVMNVPSPAMTPAVRYLAAINPDPSIDVTGAAAFAGGVFNGSVAAALAGLRLALGRTLDARQFPTDVLLAAVVVNPGHFGLTNITDACVTPGTAPFTCRAPDQYLFWDGIHPTTAAHGLIARAVAQFYGY